jgi:glycosyltransferase involved in cell wall biosynthesis
MNIICFPFHDYKTALKEGFRTRDTHLYSLFVESEGVDNVVVVNRPTLALEVVLGRKSYKTDGQVIYKDLFLYITKVEEKVYVVDILDFSFIRPVLEKKRFISKLYEKNHKYIFKALNILKIDNYISYESSPLTRETVHKLAPIEKIFDGVDNFCKHKTYTNMKLWLKSEYEIIIDTYPNVYFNSHDSISYFDCEDKANVEFLSNGVDFLRFQNRAELPSAFKRVNSSIGVYAGKMQSMFDVKLVKELAVAFPATEWFFLGKVLEGNINEVFSSYANVHFLGDIHYDKLPSYIMNATICIIPYDIEMQHGGDPIKFYEYFATGLPIVSTKIGEISSFHDDESVFIVNRSEFVESCRKALTIKASEYRKLPAQITWVYKAQYMIDKTRDDERA